MSCTVCIGAKERCEARPRIFCTYFRVNRDLTRRFVPKYHHFAPSKVTRSHVPKVQQYKIIIFYFLLFTFYLTNYIFLLVSATVMHIIYIGTCTILLFYYTNYAYSVCITVCIKYIYIYIYIIYGTYVACNVAVW